MRERLPLFVLALAVALPAQAPDLTTARLEGVVVDAMQRPVVGAQVIALIDGEEQARTQSDGEGRFIVGRLPKGVVVVRASTTTPDIGAAWVDLLGLQRGFARITLLPARKVHGTVRDAKGATVSGAWVVSAPRDSAEVAHAACTAQSDEQGRYELSHVPLGAAWLRAWAPGCDAGEATVDGIVDQQQDLIVQRDGVDVQTFVLVGSTPAERASAHLTLTATCRGVPVPLPPPLRRATLNASGEATISGWPRGDVLRARLTVPGAVVTPPRYDTIADVNDANWRFHTGAGSTCIRGVLIGNGLRVGNRLVLVQPLGAEGSLARVVCRTAHDGTFVMPSPIDRGLGFALRLCEGDATVAGQHPDPCWFLATHDSTEHQVKIAPAASVRVRVRTATGEPAAGAEVLVYYALQQPRSYPGLDEPLSAYRDAIGRGTTDLDGNATIEGLQLEPEDRLSCIVHCAEGWTEGMTSVPATLRADFRTVILQAGASLECLAGNGNSAPVPGARMQLRSNRTVLYSERYLIAGRDGRALLTGLLPGNYIARSLPGGRNLLLSLHAGENAAVVQ